MKILQQLEENKGTVSSALGKALASQVLAGDEQILHEAVELIHHESKNIRSGAAKIIEKVSEQKPEIVAPFLKKMLPAFKVKEPQTRWMLINTFGLCAKLNPKIACEGLEYAKSFLDENAGVCLSGATAKYLGKIGSLSAKKAHEVFPILEKALNNADRNEIDWLFEAFIIMIGNLDSDHKQLVKSYVTPYLSDERKITAKRAEKIIKKIGLKP